MIAQWDSSLSVLPVARAMIAQWDSSLSVLPVARVMIAQWDSSLSVLPVAWVMIAQWDSSLYVLPVARVQFPATAKYFKGFFPGCSHSASPSWASMAENGSISTQWHHTTCGQRGGRPKSNHRQTMADRKKSLYHSSGLPLFRYRMRMHDLPFIHTDYNISCKHQTCKKKN